MDIRQFKPPTENSKREAKHAAGYADPGCCRNLVRRQTQESPAHNSVTVLGENVEDDEDKRRSPRPLQGAHSTERRPQSSRPVAGFQPSSNPQIPGSTGSLGLVKVRVYRCVIRVKTPAGEAGRLGKAQETMGSPQSRHCTEGPPGAPCLPSPPPPPGPRVPDLPRGCSHSQTPTGVERSFHDRQYLFF